MEICCYVRALVYTRGSLLRKEPNFDNESEHGPDSFLCRPRFSPSLYYSRLAFFRPFFSLFFSFHFRLSLRFIRDFLLIEWFYRVRTYDAYSHTTLFAIARRYYHPPFLRYARIHSFAFPRSACLNSKRRVPFGIEREIAIEERTSMKEKDRERTRRTILPFEIRLFSLPPPSTNCT